MNSGSGHFCFGSALRAILFAALLASAVNAPQLTALDVTPAGAVDSEFGNLTSLELAREIDRVLAASWAAATIQPSPPADDAEFLRRVFLDLVGKIPSVSEQESFLADDDPQKRAKIVEDLLARGAHAQHFANTWRGLMLAGAPENVEANILVPQFETWLRLRFATDLPYDRLVTDLLTAKVEAAQPAGARNLRSFEPSPAAFFQANEQKPEQIAASTTRIFLGVQVQCAQCHDHPFSHWKQREFWSLVTFFDRPGPMNARALTRPAGGNPKAILIPGTELSVEPAFLDGTIPDWESATNKHELVSRWITATENPYFSKAAVNRLWDHFLGRGFVHPVDDLDPANPSAHTALFELLARQFILHHFDLNYLVRTITATRAYQLSSRGGVSGETDLALFARMPLRRMTADQLFASIVQATGFREAPVARRNAAIDTTSAAAEFRNRFADQTVPRTEAETSILQALALMNGKLTSDATDLEKSETLVAISDAPFLSTSDRVDVLFMASLARRPSAQERDKFVAYVEAGGPSTNSKRALSDVFWSLLNSAEFSLNH